MKKIIVLIISVFAAALNADAQESYTSIQYSVAVPFSDLKQYTGETSFRGVSVDYYSMLTPNVGLGFDAGWSVFYQDKGFSTFTEGTESISGYEYRYTNNIPIMISGVYFFMPESVINPFATLGIGTLYSKRDTDLGSLRFNEDAWLFALMPEAGLIYQFSDKIGAKVSASYFQASGNDTFNSQSYLTFNAGIVVRKF